MGPTARTHLDLEALVDRMFDQVLSAPERAELLVWIRRWEDANPDADSAERVTGWIDVAYEFQARADRQSEVRSAVRVAGWWPDGFTQQLA